MKEQYQFPDLQSMDRAIITAVGSYDNPCLQFGKHNTLTFTPTDSLMFDSSVRRTLTKYGGKQIFTRSPEKPNISDR